MIRYDKQEIISDKKLKEEQSLRINVRIDASHQSKITKLFLEELKNIKINQVPLILNISSSSIILNKDIGLSDLEQALGKELESKVDFIKEYYMHRLDDIINIVYEKEVTAIQELPYSFQSTSNLDIINYEFIA